MRWPAQSPDLNPIQHLYVEKEIKMVKPSNLNNFYAVIKNAWKNISSDRCITLINSMPRRCVEVIKNKDDPTKY